MIADERTAFCPAVRATATMATPLSAEPIDPSLLGAVQATIGRRPRCPLGSIVARLRTVAHNPKQPKSRFKLFAAVGRNKPFYRRVGLCRRFPVRIELVHVAQRAAHGTVGLRQPGFLRRRDRMPATADADPPAAGPAARDLVDLSIAGQASR